MAIQRRIALEVPQHLHIRDKRMAIYATSTYNRSTTETRIRFSASDLRYDQQSHTDGCEQSSNTIEPRTVVAFASAQDTEASSGWHHRCCCGCVKLIGSTSLGVRMHLLWLRPMGQDPSHSGKTVFRKHRKKKGVSGNPIRSAVACPWPSTDCCPCGTVALIGRQCPNRLQRTWRALGHKDSHRTELG